MRTTISLNRKWAFRKNVASPPEAMPRDWDYVNLPHTWNGIDGQDGGGDFWRGTACYVRELAREDLPEAEAYLLDFPAANASARVYVNGREAGCHEGGYSGFRLDVTSLLEEKNLLCVLVDNSKNDRIYPQVADFTFYGGLYRGAGMICVSRTRLDTEDHAFPGVHVTPSLQGNSAQVRLRTRVLHGTGHEKIRFRILDRENREAAMACGTEEEVTLTLNPVHRWNGRKDPYLYTAEVTLYRDGKALDQVQTRFGCREYRIDPEKGFFLNGESYPLRGVCRHQDRPEIGNALLPCHHREDMDLIDEVGANTIRLAHYQHSQVFYDLCDERGLIVWAEIPYISAHMDNGWDNTVSQMTDLICQNYNHPSIVVWGLSNEITMVTPTTEKMLENHRALNDLAHRLDPTRPTVMACVSMCSIDDPIVRIPDVVSYNLYFGWYGGKTDMNGPWLDTFHQKYPDTPIGISEYGADSLNWHAARTHAGDYTEEYQAWYHEQLILQLYTRPFLWATHVWNMFDFAADGRNEGGEAGVNHKGLVTFDRKYRKDAFYAYKAWLSDEKFVHICGRRYVDRVENPASVTVYSNMPEVELFANGVSLGVKTAEDHFFRFQVPNEGETILRAMAGSCEDEIRIRHVEEPNPAYILQEKGVVLNWTDITEIDGFCSLGTTIGDIVRHPEGQKLVQDMILPRIPPMPGRGKDESIPASFLNSMTVMRLVRMTQAPFTREDLLEINARLNTIPLDS